MTPRFVFFGCSWTYGKFINHVPGVDPFKNSKNEELKIANQFSYRALITKHFNANAINYSQGGSSNDQQFRYASKYFIGPTHKNMLTFRQHAITYQKIRDESWPTVEEFSKTRTLSNEIVDEITNIHLHNNEFEIYRDWLSSTYVIWFITSTARKEFYNNSAGTYENEMLTDPKSLIAKQYVLDYYSHEHELETMAQQMVLWNEFFKSKNIKNIWIDTFNHHEYPVHVKNRLKFDSQWSDIMSNLCVANNFFPEDTELHLSTWESDESRSNFLKKIGLLNPTTLHPTLECHAIIADMLIPLINKHFDLPKETE